MLGYYGDDSTDQSGVSTDSTGMPVVTVVASQNSGLPTWPLWLVLGIAAYMIFSGKKP